MDNKLSELSKPVGFVSDRASTQLKEGDPASIRPFFDVQGSSPLYSQEYVSALLAELEREQGIRAQNLEIKTLLAEKIKGLETKLWDSQQLVDAKSGSQIELRSQISSLEERNRKDMAWRGERLCELEDSLEAAQKRIAELETKLSEMTTFRDNALNKALRHWEELLELRAKLATPVRLPTEHELHQVACSECAGNCLELVESTVRSAGFKCVGDE
ncbi:hypothetical protein [Serratia quinivorans]|uniref:hypothetical protein n=1 Tax=Serratia quinivorans TaxID=137545 RepID=UPI00217717E0|nr:hypothetical protein [Serratia quinivorans]CAI0911109.1 Uncharacterised protein [Serratia quinivorans]